MKHSLTKRRMYVAIRLSDRTISGYCNADPTVGDPKYVAKWVADYIKTGAHVIYNVSYKWIEKHWLGDKV